VPHEETKHQGQFAVWGSAEYLLWWVKNQPVSVPLVTTGNAATQGTAAGTIGSPGTALLFGISDLDYHTFSGGRFSLGLGFGSEHDSVWGVEGSGFFLEKRPAGFAASSATGNPVLARPFVDARTGTESTVLVSETGVDTGSVAISSFSDLYGWDVDLVGGFYRDGVLHLVLLGGFRYLNLSESLDIVQNSTLVPIGAAGFGGGLLVPPSNVTLFDHFGTRNEFYGGQLGARVEYGDRLLVSAYGKIALGSTHEVINLAGFTSGIPGGTKQGGLLVLPSNAGSRAHDEFTAVPEIGFNVGYQVCRWLQVYAGYTFFYWSEVARPADQINRIVNPTLIPASRTFGAPTGPAQPTFSFQRTDFWAQGANIGLALRW
jgi:hypothetical protein